MQPSDISALTNLEMNLTGRWVAIDTRGGDGLRALPSGAVLVDFDVELDALCLRVMAAGRQSLTIFQCNQNHRRPRA